MGFWLAEVADPADAPDGPTIELILGPPPASATTPDDGFPAGGSRRRPAQTARLKAPNNTDGDLLLILGPRGARIFASPGAWAALAEPVLLAACQYWRFLAVEAQLDRLTEQSRADLPHATMPGVDSLRRARRLAKRGEAVRALIVDLAHFEGPLTDPLPYCSSERAANAYRALAEKLRLEEYCELIDERTEVVEDTYEAATEKLFEYKNFAWEAVLEALIIVILLAELALTAWEMFGP
jgi:hypothetical protein